MKNILLVLPDTIDLDNKEAAMIIAAKLYEQGKLSSGQAAEIAGYSKRTFLELLSQYNIPLFHYDPSEVAMDIENAAGHHI